MNDSISMFIDDELNLDEKVTFVKNVHNEDRFYAETVDLLEQEKLLRSDVVLSVPMVQLKQKSPKKGFRFSFKPLFRVAEFGVMAALVLFFVFSLQPKEDAGIVTKRFVIYQPGVSSVQIAGSFTDWHNVPMKMVGPSGYWEIELDVTKGEHKYVYIVGDNKKIADPTILMKERDDFGSENSVLIVEA